MIALLHGAKKNVGDFLIFNRCRDLAGHFLNQNDFIEYERWRPLDEHIAAINRTDGIVLCGGPLYARNMYPKIMPFVSRLEDIKVPIVPVGIGWHSKNNFSFENFRFDTKTLEFIRQIHSRIVYSGVRCPDTLAILNKHRIDNVLLTGCPALYDLKSMGKPLQAYGHINRIVVSDPADLSLYLKVIGLIRRIKKVFTGVEINFCFHRGIQPDGYTSLKTSLAARLLKVMVKSFGCLVHDVSSSTENIEFYRECDLHIGFRVHAHVFFASIRKPTFLLQEDGRGIGMSKLMGVGDVNARRPNAVAHIMDRVERSVEVGFRNFAHIPDLIDEKFLTMRKVFKGSLG